MLARTLLAALAIACCATAAQAGAVYGTSATTSAKSSFISQTGADSNMDGAPDGSHARFVNFRQQSGQQTFTVTWDVTGAGGLIHWQLFVDGRTDANVSIVGVTLSDGTTTATSTNSLALNTGPVSPSAITMFELTGFQSQGDYGSVGSGFDWSSIVGLSITFQLDNPVGTGGRSPINIDAVANPEPGTLALFGLGILGLGAALRRRRRVTRS